MLTNFFVFEGVAVAGLVLGDVSTVDDCLFVFDGDAVAALDLDDVSTVDECSSFFLGLDPFNAGTRVVSSNSPSSESSLLLT